MLRLPLARVSLMVAPLLACDALMSRIGSKAEPAPADATTPGLASPETPPGAPAAAPPELRVVAVAAAEQSSYALMDDGSVRAWGDVQRVSGDPSRTVALTPIAVPGIAGARAIFAGGKDHGCVALEGGKVKCWDDKGMADVEAFTGASQIAIGLWDMWAAVDGQPRCRDTPGCLKLARYGTLTGIQQLRRGRGHLCALTGGAVSCWGDNESGQAMPSMALGPKVPQVMAVRDVAGAIDVAVADRYSCALLADRTATCWGVAPDNYASARFGRRKVAPLAGVANISGFAAGASGHLCMIADGKAYCLGDNTRGQGGVDPRATPVTSAAQVVEGVGDVVSLAVGGSHTCAATRDGNAWCWGGNDSGALGDGTLEDRFTPRPVASVGARTLPPVTPPAAPPDADQDFNNLPAGCTHGPLKLTAKGAAEPDFEIKATTAEIRFQENGDEMWIFLRDRGLGPISRHDLQRGTRPGERTMHLVLQRTDIRYGAVSAAERQLYPDMHKKSEDYLPIAPGIYTDPGFGIDDEREQSQVLASASVTFSPLVGSVRVSFKEPAPGSRQQVEVTHLGPDWVCGKIDVKDAQTAISGPFIARMDW